MNKSELFFTPISFKMRIHWFGVVDGWVNEKCNGDITKIESLRSDFFSKLEEVKNTTIKTLVDHGRIKSMHSGLTILQFFLHFMFERIDLYRHLNPQDTEIWPEWKHFMELYGLYRDSVSVDINDPALLALNKLIEKLERGGAIPAAEKEDLKLIYELIKDPNIEMLCLFAFLDDDFIKQQGTVASNCTTPYISLYKCVKFLCGELESYSKWILPIYEKRVIELSSGIEKLNSAQGLVDRSIKNIYNLRKNLSDLFNYAKFAPGDQNAIKSLGLCIDQYRDFPTLSLFPQAVINCDPNKKDEADRLEIISKKLNDTYQTLVDPYIESYFSYLPGLLISLYENAPMVSRKIERVGKRVFHQAVNTHLPFPLKLNLPLEVKTPHVPPLHQKQQKQQKKVKHKKPVHALPKASSSEVSKDNGAPVHIDKANMAAVQTDCAANAGVPTPEPQLVKDNLPHRPDSVLTGLHSLEQECLMDSKQKAYLLEAIWHMENLAVLDKLLCDPATKTSITLNLFVTTASHAAWALELIYRYILQKQMPNDPESQTHNLILLHQQVFQTSPSPIVKELYLANHWCRFFIELHERLTSYSTQTEIPPLLQDLVDLAKDPAGNHLAMKEKCLDIIAKSVEQAAVLLDISRPSSPKKKKDPVSKAFSNDYEMNIGLINQQIKKMEQLVSLDWANEDPRAYAVFKQSKISLIMLINAVECLNKKCEPQQFALWVTRSLFLMQEHVERMLQTIIQLREDKTEWNCHEVQILADKLKINSRALGSMLSKLSTKTRYPASLSDNGLGCILIDRVEALRRAPEINEGFETVKSKNNKSEIWKVPDKNVTANAVLKTLSNLIDQCLKESESLLMPVIQEEFKAKFKS